MRYDDKEVEKDVIDETESINLVTTLIQLLCLFTLKIQFENQYKDMKYEILQSREVGKLNAFAYYP